MMKGEYGQECVDQSKFINHIFKIMITSISIMYCLKFTAQTDIFGSIDDLASLQRCKCIIVIETNGIHVEKFNQV